MSIDDETLARIRAALEDSERIDATRIEIDGDGGEATLRGSVATAEEASVAAMIAAEHAPGVRDELAVDAGLREDPAVVSAADDSSNGDPGHIGPATDLTTEVEEALGENIAWDPPDEPQFAPTAAEQRAAGGTDAGAPPDPGGEDIDPANADPSAPDLSAAELRRRARPSKNED